MAKAARQEAKHRQHQRLASPTMVNIDFLRSGREFLTLPERVMSTAPGSNSDARKTKAERLQDFYRATQNNAIVTSKTAANAASQASTIVNMAFLRSGKEFEAVLPSPPPARRDSAKMMSRNARLVAFHKTMQAANERKAAATKAGRPGQRWSAAAPASIVNMAFLRSGKEFEGVPLGSLFFSPSPSASSASSGSSAGPKASRNARLESFYSRTQASAVYTPPAARRAMPPRPPASATTVQSPPTMVNLQFLRSGKEFFQAASADRSVEQARVTAVDAAWRAPGPKLSKHARERAFYAATLKAAAAPAAKAPPTPTISPSLPGTVPTVVNLKFLQSGKEFFKLPASPTLLGGAPANGLPTGPKKSRNARLEEFYGQAQTQAAIATASSGAANEDVVITG